MIRFRRPPTSGVLLALAFLLALLAPGGAAGAAAGTDPSASLAAGPAAGLEQGLVRDRAGGSRVAPGSKRDHRERHGPALLGVVAAALAASLPLTVVARRGADRPGRLRPAAAAAARAPPSLQPAPI
jgi:hypothetical protein